MDVFMALNRPLLLDFATVQRIRANDPALQDVWFHRQDDEEEVEINETIEQQIQSSSKIYLTDKDDNFLLTLTTSLRSNTSVRELYFSGDIIPMNGWKAIFEVLQTKKNIQKLVIQDGTNFDATCAHLFATAVLSNFHTPICRSLKYLDVEDTSICLKGIFEIVSALCANPKGCPLLRLSLMHTVHENDATVEMREQLAVQFIILIQHNTSKLKHLYLSSIYLGDDFVTVFSIGLKHNTKLLKFYFQGPYYEFPMQGNVVTSVGAIALASALDYNKTLLELYLSNNAIGDKGANALAGTLQNNNNQLMELFLRNNGITNIGAQALATALHYNRTLVRLDVSCNNIDDVGTTAIASALRYNTQLKRLNLCRCQITSIGANALANALYYNRTLVELYLHDNPITDDGEIALGNSLRYHPSIEHLCMNENPLLGDDACEFLKYNESIQFAYFDFHNTATLQSILDYNDTIWYAESESDDIQQLLQQNLKRTRLAPKKGLRRKQEIYSWLLKISGL